MQNIKRALVVDDDPYWRDRMEKVAIACGYEVTTATGYHDAQDRLNAEKFDIFVTDNQMEYADSGALLIEYLWYLDKEIPTFLYTGDLTQRALDIIKVSRCAVGIKKERSVDDTALREAIQNLKT